MIRPATIVWLILVAVVGYAMFQVKYEVIAQEDTLAHLNKQIADGREQIRVLDAEWSYLTRPDRLSHLATRYLDLAPIGAAQILDLGAIPERPGAAQALVSARDPASSLQTLTAQTGLAQLAKPGIAAVNPSAQP